MKQLLLIYICATTTLFAQEATRELGTTSPAYRKGRLPNRGTLFVDIFDEAGANPVNGHELRATARLYVSVVKAARSSKEPGAWAEAHRAMAVGRQAIHEAAETARGGNLPKTSAEDEEDRLLKIAASEIGSVPVGGPFFQAVAQDTGEQILLLLRDHTNAERRAAAAREMGDKNRETLGNKIFDAAQEPQAAKLYNDFLGAETVPVDASVESMIVGRTGIKNRLQSVEQFKKLLDAIKSGIKQVPPEELKALVVAGMKEILAEQAKDLHDREQRERDYTGIGSIITAVSVLVGEKDPKTAREIEIYGHNSLAVVKAAETFLNALEKNANKLTSEMIKNLSFDLVAVAVNLMQSLLGGKSESQMILESLEDLKEMVANLREEMHDRFNVVDIRFNQIFAVLQDIKGDIRDVQTSTTLLNDKIDELRSSVAALDENVRYVGADVLTLEIQQTLNPCRYHKKLDDKTFVTCFEKLRSLIQTLPTSAVFAGNPAILNARADAIAGKANQSSAYKNVSRSLAMHGVWASINPLKSLSASHVKWASSDNTNLNGNFLGGQGSVGNALMWRFFVDEFIDLFGSRADLIATNEDEIETILEDIINQGNGINSSLAHIRTANEYAPLYTSLVDALALAETSMRTAAREHMDSMRVKFAKGLDFFKPVAGQKPPENTVTNRVILRCKETLHLPIEEGTPTTEDKGWDVGSKETLQYIPEVYQIAEAIGLGTISLCISDFHWQNQRTEFPHPNTRQLAKANASIHFRFIPTGGDPIEFARRRFVARKDNVASIGLYMGTAEQYSHDHYYPKPPFVLNDMVEATEVHFEFRDVRAYMHWYKLLNVRAPQDGIEKQLFARAGMQYKSLHTLWHEADGILANGFNGGNGEQVFSEEQTKKGQEAGEALVNNRFAEIRSQHAMDLVLGDHSLPAVATYREAAQEFAAIRNVLAGYLELLHPQTFKKAEGLHQILYGAEGIMNIEQQAIHVTKTKGKVQEIGFDETSPFWVESARRLHSLREQLAAIVPPDANKDADRIHFIKVRLKRMHRILEEINPVTK